MDIGGEFCQRVLARFITSTCLLLIAAMGELTDRYIGVANGLGLALILYAVLIRFRNISSQYMESGLFKRICLLFSSVQLRKLLIISNQDMISIIADFFLAILLSCVILFLYRTDHAKRDDDTSGSNKDEMRQVLKGTPSEDKSTEELQKMLLGLMYLYGNMLDFLFRYGALAVTVCAFGASLLMQAFSLQTNSNSTLKFCINLASIINANLLSDGINLLIPITHKQLSVLQCLASVCILRKLIPAMQFYYAYLASERLHIIAPDLGPLFFCLYICLQIHTQSEEKEWIIDICFTYVMRSLSAWLTQLAFLNTIIILTLAQYVEHILNKYKS